MRKLLTAVFLVILVSSLAGCGGSARHAPLEPVPNPQEEHYQQLAEEMRTEIAVERYEHWYHDQFDRYDEFLYWLESSEYDAYFDYIREWIIEWEDKVLSYPIDDVPDSHKVEHEHLRQRAMDLRAWVE